MPIRKLILIILIIISPSIIFRLEASADSPVIRIHDRSNAVDINDIINIESDKLSEIDVKRICADITGRYHELGYTAFYIKKAELNKGGTADLFFIEAVVSDVVVNGVTSRKDDITLSVFKPGELFNELTLKENLAETKKKYNLKRLNVDVIRKEEKQIVLSVNAAEKNNEIETGIFNSPIYGIIPELKYRINYGGFLAGASLSSSFGREERSFSGGSFYFNSDNIPGSSYFTLSADYADKKDSFTGEDGLIYTHKTLASRGGYCFNSGASSVMLFAAGTADELEEYPGEDGGFSFSGFELKLVYDSSNYKIDYSDAASAHLDVFSGWNFIEDRPSVKGSFNYVFNIPMQYGFFFSLNGNSIYTSDNERFSHFYAYDRYFPCRDGDYSIASWRNVAGVDIAYEAMRRNLSILPGLKWGMHNAGDGNNNVNVCAAGIEVFFNTEVTKIELSYYYDINQNIDDGFLMFSLAAVY